MVGNEEWLQFVVSLKTFTSHSMKWNNLRRHLVTSQPKHKEKSIDFFRKQLLNCRAQQSCFNKAASVLSTSLLQFVNGNKHFLK